MNRNCTARVASLAPQGMGKLPYGHLSISGLVGFGALVAQGPADRSRGAGPEAGHQALGSTLGIWQRSASS